MRPINGRVSCFSVYHDELYVGGQFNDLDGVLKWNGTTFDTLAGSHLLDIGRVEAMAVYDGELYFGGGINYRIGQEEFRNIARWNGTEISSVGSGCDNVVYSMAVYNENLYVGGDMNYAGTAHVNGIAKWNGEEWSGLNGGIGSSARVFELKVYDGELYAAGNFNFSELDTKCVARWNGTQWNEVGPGGIPGVVYSLGSYQNGLYAGGPYFTIAGGVNVNQIAKWDGNQWTDQCGGLELFHTFNGFDINSVNVFALEEYHGELYAGGEFNKIDGKILKGVSRYDGWSWTAVGSGVDSTGIVTC